MTSAIVTQHIENSRQDDDSISHTSLSLKPARLQLMSPSTWLPSPTWYSRMDASDEEDDEKSQMKELLDDRPTDLEAQAAKSDQQPIAAEYLVSARVKRYSNATYLSLIPIIAGVGMATYGDYYFTTVGLILTFFGVILASIKTVVTNRLMTGELALPPLEILLRMSPLAALQSLMYATASGEVSRIMVSINAGEISSLAWLALAGNGFLAFLLNVSSFQTNKLAGALTISVCSNLKQCLTILLGIVLFDVKVGLWNGLGMLVTLAGAAVYSKVELDAKAAKQNTQTAQEGSS
ncbi:MAG: hypothetical protein Q9157_007264 [Trypethelium eluteriae]